MEHYLALFEPDLEAGGYVVRTGADTSEATFKSTPVCYATGRSTFYPL